jgi:hypothetical protein
LRSSTTPATCANPCSTMESCLLYVQHGERAVVRYAGDVDCRDPYVGLQDDADAVPVDVRTNADQCGVRLHRASRSHADRAREPCSSNGNVFRTVVRTVASWSSCVKEGCAWASLSVFCAVRVCDRAQQRKASPAAGLGAALSVSDGFEGQLGQDGHRTVTGRRPPDCPGGRAERSGEREGQSCR